MNSLKLKRIEMNWSQSELARRANMSHSDINKIESGRLIPYDSQLIKIAEALGYPVKNRDDLLKECTVTINKKGN